MANAGGADIINLLKLDGGWMRSSTVAKKYVEESIENETKIDKMLQKGEIYVQVLQQASTNLDESMLMTNKEGNTLISFNDCNVTINVNKF